MRFSHRVVNWFFPMFFLLLSLTAEASSRELAHHDFWRPIYNVQRLNYCLADGKTCGMPVANRYCQSMGFERAEQGLIEYNVGRSHYLEKTNLDCRSWRCNGFKVIRCVHSIQHNPVPAYDYRERQFVAPHAHHCRIDWCLSKNKQCGKPVADSFCKRHGYQTAKSFKKKLHVSCTRTIGSQELCRGSDCIGFEDLVCYR